MIGNKKLILNYKFIFLLLIFIISTLYTFAINNLNYNSTKAPDYMFYKDYIHYFFGEFHITGREQGLIYFFIISFILKFIGEGYGLESFDFAISNSIQLSNYILYLIGLLGLYKLLVFKKFDKQNILFSFIILNFIPQTINLLITMKPEILAFAFLTWSFFLIEKFKDENNTKYLYLAIFPNLILLSSKGTIVGSIVIIYFIFFLINFKKFNNYKFYKFLLFFVFLLVIINYENFLANGKFILSHINTGPQFQYRAPLSIIYNINFIELFITNPFRNNHANSLIGIILLDTFGDYFQHYALEDKNLFAFSRKDLPNLFFISYWTQLISIIITSLYYSQIFLNIKNDKRNWVYYFLPFFGIMILLIQSFGFPSINFDLYVADLFKTHYYSYLILISISFVLCSLFLKYPKLKFVMFILILFSYNNLYSVDKIDSSGYNDALKITNYVSLTCQINSVFIEDFNSNNCNSPEIRICKIGHSINNGHYLTEEKLLINSEFNIYLPRQELYKGDLSYTPRNQSECLEYVSNLYYFKNYLNNKINLPWINISSFVISILIFLYLILKKNSDNMVSNA